MIPYFILTVFLSATLLFSVQPMVAKTLLPVFGGSSSVWTTCMLFYQTVLLLGYLYAHFVMKHMSRKVQLSGHVAMLILALFIGYRFDTPVPPPNSDTIPVLWLILQLGLVSGMPFFMISSAGPLVQGWFARTGHPRANDPYFLYAASNAGSFIGLLAYPFLIEPALGLDTQRLYWLIGFGVFIALSIGAILMTKKGHTEEPVTPPSDVIVPKDEQSGCVALDDVIDWRRRFRWIFYAFVPSSMLLGVTSHISMDIASFPLLWVLPLAVYLLTMIVAFAVNAQKLIDAIRRPMVFAVIGATILVLATDAQTYAPLPALVAVQLLLLVVVGLMGHGMLASDRPSAKYLTEFYLVMSIGGALGGVFNGIVAPLVFDMTLEYQIVLLCAVGLLPWRKIKEIADPKERKKALFVRTGLPVVSLVYMLVMGLFAYRLLDLFGVSLVNQSSILFGMIIFIPAIFIYLAWSDGLACMLVLAVPLGGSIVEQVTDPKVLYRDRTFYGIINIIDEFFYDPNIDDVMQIRSMMHGTTNHGVQYIHEDFSQVALGYYHSQGPLGMGIDALRKMRPEGIRLGIVGLGSGAITAHGTEGDFIRYFEIDPEVARLAENPEYFTYLSDAECEVGVKVGDGRLLLEQERDEDEEPYDMVLIDAFSSDSIPVHLLTTEAVELYFNRNTEDGMVMIHISNRHLDLQPLVYELGKTHKAFVMMRNHSTTEVPEHMRDYLFPSVWVALTKDPETAQELLNAGFYQEMEPNFEVRMWTDQYSNILSLFAK